MTPEQLTWTDKQWATYLGCPVQEVSKIRVFIKENFFPLIAQDTTTGEYNFVMTRMHESMSGTKSVIQMMSSMQKFSTSESAAKHANNEIIPVLEFTHVWAQSLGVPERALQMLHIKER
jgi:hypothetical protein